ncbi:MAG: TRAP transporter small permease [Acidobacteriota bacterium]
MPRLFLERSERAVRLLLEKTVVVLLSAIAVICFVEVVLRYGFGRSFGWYDEFTGYLLVWLTFLGAVLAQQQGRHIGVENLFERLGRQGRRLLMLFVQALLIAIHLVLLAYGSQLVARFLSDRAITLPVPMGIVYLVIPLSAALMLSVQVMAVTRLLRKPSTES